VVVEDMGKDTSKDKINEIMNLNQACDEENDVFDDIEIKHMDLKENNHGQNAQKNAPKFKIIDTKEDKFSDEMLLMDDGSSMSLNKTLNSNNLYHNLSQGN